MFTYAQATKHAHTQLIVWVINTTQLMIEWLLVYFVFADLKLNHKRARFTAALTWWGMLALLGLNLLKKL